VREICAESFAAGVIAELKQHAEMLKWAKDGLDYHTTHTLERCLFCGNDFTQARAEALRQSIDDRFERTVDTIQRLQSERATQFDVLDKFQQRLPAAADFDDSLSAKYSAIRDKLVEAVSSLHAILTQARAPLDAKARTPNLAIDTSVIKVERAQALAEAVVSLIADINVLISQHNDKISRFEQEKDNAKTALKAHHLLEAQEKYKSLRDDLASAEKETETRTRLCHRLQSCVERTRQQLRSHGLAVEPINKLLASYLGHGDLTLTTLETGYQIQRKGEPIDGPLSEGEKTALAICYFLSKLEENGRELEETIVVIDDPISSLDTKALNYAFNLLKLALGEAAQVIFLTHNLQFMNETKKWLKPLSREGDKPPTATLLFLEVKLVNGKIRTTMIKSLPKLLRDYDSEYHYLCHLIFLFVNAEADNAHLGYVLPNVLRKVLELFLTFKMPGPEGLGSKLKHEYVRSCGISEARINALSRLADTESHGDNLDDLIGLSSTTVEETRDAAKSLLELMEKLDTQHFGRIQRLCR
jgi:wobble nucleotide-excising tRNase